MVLSSRSLHAAMDDASSPLVNTTLSFMSSSSEEEEDDDDDDVDGKGDAKEAGEEQKNHKRNRNSSSDDTSVDSKDVVPPQDPSRCRSRRTERLDVTEGTDKSHGRRVQPSPRKTVPQRSHRKKHLLTPHGRDAFVRKCSGRLASPPCASPATLLSGSLGSKLSMKSPVVTRMRLQVKMVLQRLVVVDWPSHFVTTYDDLQTIRWLGAGVSAEVYKVRDQKSGEVFAIKKSKQELRNKQERDLRTREIVALQKLHTSRRYFDHIVRPYQAWQENGFFFLQMELCEGGTLQDFMTKRKSRDALPENYLWIILQDIATGLHVLHEHDIVHLDIKPDNIFITEDGKLKIGDFGMAGNVTALADSSSGGIGDLEGDAKYIAKELLTSAARLPSADIFCLGITLLEIATQVALPEAGKEWHNLREGELPCFPSTYSKKLSETVRQMMHPDALKRPSASDILEICSVRTDNKPAMLFIEHALEHKLAVPSKVRNTSRSAQNGQQTPRKTPMP
uniref:Protein kinase domain-containing protein n=1 Tax=Peronospora matthiolae TaxID=2874970 RepID=A0AAV1SZS3_9STRA